MENSYFKKIGLGFPSTAKELDEFNNVYKDHKLTANINAVNPEAIFAAIQSAKTKITRIDYHKRLVLAAEIISQLHKENTIGHIKIQKLMYLSQHSTGMQLHTKFLRQAMGPYDPKLMRSLDIQLKKNKWFEYTPGNFPLYKPLENNGGHVEWFQRYFEKDIDKIHTIIKLFKKATSEQVELVATIYACWLEAKQQKVIISPNLIVNRIYEWSIEKSKFNEERIISAFNWMKVKGIVPI